MGCLCFDIGRGRFDPGASFRLRQDEVKARGKDNKKSLISHRPAKVTAGKPTQTHTDKKKSLTELTEIVSRQRRRVRRDLIEFLSHLPLCA